MSFDVQTLLALMTRGLVIACLGVLAAVTICRGVLGAFFTADYPALRSAHPANVAGALLNHVAPVLRPLAALVAWREEAERELKRLAERERAGVGAGPLAPSPARGRGLG